MSAHDVPDDLLDWSIKELERALSKKRAEALEKRMEEEAKTDIFIALLQVVRKNEEVPMLKDIPLFMQLVDEAVITDLRVTNDCRVRKASVKLVSPLGGIRHFTMQLNIEEHAYELRRE